MTSTPQTNPTISHTRAEESTLFIQLRPEASRPTILQESSHRHRNSLYPISMATPVQATPVQATQLPDEVIKLIQEFVKWLVTTKVGNSTEWDKKSDGIYECIHPHLKEKIQPLKEKLVCPK